MEAPFRLTQHHTSPTDSHYDLFILLPGKETLLTYGIEWSAETEGLLLLSTSKGKKRLICLTKEEVKKKSPENLLIAKRKRDHRIFYWTFSGPLLKKSGILTDILRGEITLPNIDEILFLGLV